MVAPTKTKEAQHNVEFAEGGSDHMFGPQKAGPDKPGNTGKDPGSDGKFAKGGSGKMFGFAGAQEAKAGQTGAR